MQVQVRGRASGKADSNLAWSLDKSGLYAAVVLLA
jgi:hypothetical protein